MNKIKLTGGGIGWGVARQGVLLHFHSDASELRGKGYYGLREKNSTNTTSAELPRRPGDASGAPRLTPIFLRGYFVSTCRTYHGCTKIPISRSDPLKSLLNFGSVSRKVYFWTRSIF